MRQFNPTILRKLIMAAAIALPASVSAEGLVAVMLAKDGTSYEIALDRVSRIALGADDVTIESVSGDNTSMPYTDVDRILIGAKPSGVADAVSRGEIAVYPTVTDREVHIAGADAGAPVRVYGIDGSLVCTATAADGVTTLDVSQARAGMLLVQVAGHTVKIIKK